MQKLTIPLLFLSLSFVGCGDKSKKKTVATAPVVADTAGPDDSGAEPVVEKTEAERLAELQATVYFEFDSSELDESARASLQENATWMGEDEARVLTIEGHTDETGTTDYNLALGERRARITKDYLVRLGVDGKRVQIITYGEERPAGADDALNRRSVFVATKK